VLAGVAIVIGEGLTCRVVIPVVELAVMVDGMAVAIGVDVVELTTALNTPGEAVGAGLAKRSAFGSGSVPGLGVGVGIATGAGSELVRLDDVVPTVNADAN
jgi:hypothetical protein